MPTLSELQAAQATALTAAFKAQQNREAARVATLVALYYQRRVNVENPQSVERWLDLMIPRIITGSDNGARQAAAYFEALRRIEVPLAERFAPTAATGAIDEGVRKSLLAVGPFDWMNKATQIRALDELDGATEKAMLAQAKDVTTKKIAAATLRHVQAGSRQTVFDNTEADKTCLGYVRVTRDNPCFFCAMLASRGLSYRPFKEDSFEMSDQQFTGDGNAKVHDNCGCSLKPVYTSNDPLVDKTKVFAEMWKTWAEGPDQALAFRRAYEAHRDAA